MHRGHGRLQKITGRQKNCDSGLTNGNCSSRQPSAKSCKVIGYHDSKHTYEMSDSGTIIPLSETVIEKDIGVKVDNHLLFIDHIKQAASRVNGILGIIQRSYTYLD